MTLREMKIKTFSLIEEFYPEEKALAEDEDVIAPLLYLRQREVVHFNRFKDLYEKYKKMGY